jgi:uroporphyrinogen-III decarboxylase
MNENYPIKSKWSQNFINEHNEEAQSVWESFNEGNPIRPPVVLGTATQYFIFNKFLNPDGKINFKSYCTNANKMLDFSLRAALWRIENIAPYCDDLIRLPEKWIIRVDLQNFDEAAFFGAPVEFLPDQVPDTRPILSGDRKNALFDMQLPDPLMGGWYGKAHQIYDTMQAYLHENPTYLDRPVIIEPFGYWTGGFLTIAIALRGQELFTDFYEDPQYVHDLLEFITKATIMRVKAHYDYFGLSFPDSQLFFTDDAIQMISVKMLKQFLLPLYKKYKSTVTRSEKIKMHLCGNASRHFKILKDELGVYDFETGFPIDFGNVRKQLGSEVIIHGGPNIMLLKDGTPDEVRIETRRILESGVMEGGKFVLREGNNLAPHTPFGNLEAMYQQAKCYKY